MSIKSKVFAGAAALSVIVGGLGVAGAATAHAATPSCGSACVEISNGGAVLDVYKGAKNVNQKIILWGETNYDPAIDFTLAWQGTVHQFYKAGLGATAALNLHYGHNWAFELQYAPYGVNSGLCVGVASANGGQVTLQKCGANAKTLWVYDPTKSGVVLINGADTNFSDPTVLSNRAGLAYASPLRTSANGTVYDSQVWDYATGVAP
jgi:hypothetical protein